MKRTGKQWELTNTGGKLKKEIPFEASALPGQGGPKAKLSEPHRAVAPVKDQRSSIPFTEPMECKPVEDLPEGEGWTYEVKLDGYRAQAVRDADTVSLALPQREVSYGTVSRSCPGPPGSTTWNRRGRIDRGRR